MDCRDVVMIGFAAVDAVSVDADLIDYKSYVGGPRTGRRGIRAVGSPDRCAPAPKPRGGSRAAVDARTGTISVCDAVFCMKTDRAVAQAIGGGVIASLVGAILCFTATAASAEGPLKLAGSQLEPIKWTELAGWSADDHLAAFAAYQASCQALRKRRTDDHGPISWRHCRTSAARP